MNKSDISVRMATNADCKNVQKLVFGVLCEYKLNPDRKGIDNDLDDINSNYFERGGIFELLEDSKGNLVGTVGLYPIDNEQIELRKMYFAKEIRGKGLGKSTLKRMIEISKELGYKQIVLETASVLKEAIGLYKKFGFIESKNAHTPRCDQSFYLKL